MKQVRNKVSGKEKFGLEPGINPDYSIEPEHFHWEECNDSKPINMYSQVALCPTCTREMRYKSQVIEEPIANRKRYGIRDVLKRAYQYHSRKYEMFNRM